jgi:hypothetical protein
MKGLMSATLIILGALWVFYATIIPAMMRTRALSDAMQLEANLKRWTSEKVYDGTLQESDVREIFPEGYALRFGGENPNKSFREMILDIARSSAPPAWPGVLSVLIGGAGAVSYFRARNNKQAQNTGRQATAAPSPAT